MQEHFNHSQRAVLVSIHTKENGTDGGCVSEVSLRSPAGTLDTAAIENFSYFRSQISHGDFLQLERCAPSRFKILGIVKRGSILHEVYQIAFKNNLEFGFNEDVEREVSELEAQEIDWNAYEDYRDIPFVTVDGEGTRDLDQAMYIGTPDDGIASHGISYRQDAAIIAWYAIADASWFVRPNTPLWREALRRGTSIYFAGMSVPMLPPALSQGIVSLNENVDRRALVFIMQVNADGICLETQIRRAVIHSRAKLANEEVTKFLADPQNHPYSKTEYAANLRNFKTLGLIRLRESRTRNVVSFNRVNLEVGLNPQRTSFVLGFDERLDVDTYTEQISLLCNMEGAKILSRLAETNPDVLAVFRNHEAPSMRDVEDLERAIHDIAAAQDMPEIWYWNREKQRLADYFESLPPESCICDDNAPPEVQKMFRIRQAIERQVLMVQRRSVFSPDAGLHSALGVNPYARFSAPMREIVGIFTHKEAIEAEFDVPPALSPQENAALRLDVINASNEAKNVQREVDKAIDSCAIAHVISHDFDVPTAIRPRRRGTILGMKPSALYVRLDTIPIELKIYIKDIAEASGESWSLNEEMTVLSNDSGTKRYIIGDSIFIFVSSYEARKHKWRVIPC